MQAILLPTLRTLVTLSHLALAQFGLGELLMFAVYLVPSWARLPAAGEFAAGRGPSRTGTKAFFSAP